MMTLSDATSPLLLLVNICCQVKSRQHFLPLRMKNSTSIQRKTFYRLVGYGYRYKSLLELFAFLKQVPEKLFLYSTVQEAKTERIQATRDRQPSLQAESVSQILLDVLFLHCLQSLVKHLHQSQKSKFLITFQQHSYQE